MKRIRVVLKKVKSTLSGYKVKSRHEKKYQQTLREITIRRSADTKCAVVIHLFYTDNWPLFKKRLSYLKHHAFDLFITMPQENFYFTEEIQKTFPDVTVVVVPNHGRDVLPFVKVAKKLSDAGYEYVLKFHSKKSTHRKDGQDWLEDMLNKLLPSKQSLLDAIFNKLEDRATGIVGPADVYYPLTVNFPANGPHMTEVVKSLYGKRAAHQYLQLDRGNYGFFGGTMFWARLDAIKPLLDFSVYRFEAEKGQIDATFAHALERLFSIVSEINARKNYEITTNKVVARPYKSNNIPEWSEDHLK